MKPSTTITGKLKATRSRKDQAFDAGIIAAKNLYADKFMKSVAGIIAVTAIDAYDKELRRLQRRRS